MVDECIDDALRLHRRAMATFLLRRDTHARRTAVIGRGV